MIDNYTMNYIKELINNNKESMNYNSDIENTFRELKRQDNINGTKPEQILIDEFKYYS